MKQISTEYWHDGNIHSVYYSFPLTERDKAKIIIEAEIYRAQNGKGINNKNAVLHKHQKGRRVILPIKSNMPEGQRHKEVHHA